MNLTGIIIGVILFILIAVSHVFVIKGEYHVGKKIWLVFFLIGTGLLAGSIFLSSDLYSGILGVTGIVFLWGAYEVFEQQKRVKKGWFPKKK